MAKLLVVYGTTEGQTRKIAQHVAAVAREFGHTVHTVDSAIPAPLGRGYDAVVVAGSLHRGKHQPSLTRFVRGNLTALAHVPTAFFSVSLSAAGSDLAGAQRCADAFVMETGWVPGMMRLVAGALAYTRYGWAKRWMMQRIAARAGGDTDTTRDWEYTDWARLRADVEEFLLRAVPAAEPAIVSRPVEVAQPALSGAGAGQWTGNATPWPPDAYAGRGDRHLHLMPRHR